MSNQKNNVYRNATKDLKWLFWICLFLSITCVAIFVYFYYLDIRFFINYYVPNVIIQHIIVGYIKYIIEFICIVGYCIMLPFTVIPLFWNLFTFNKYRKAFLLHYYTDYNQSKILDNSKKIVVVYLTCNDFIWENMEYNIQQTYKNIDWIILDDSSKQEFKNLVNKFKVKYPFVKVMHTPKDYFHGKKAPVADALNYFFSTYPKNYDYFLRNDASTFYPHDYIQKQIHMFSKLQDLGIICGFRTIRRNYLQSFYSKVLAYDFAEYIGSLHANAKLRMANTSDSCFGYAAPIFSKKALEIIDYKIPLYVAEDQLVPMIVQKNNLIHFQNPACDICQYSPSDFNGRKKQVIRVCSSTMNIEWQYLKFSKSWQDKIFNFIVIKMAVSFSIFFGFYFIYGSLFSVFFDVRTSFFNIIGYLFILTYLPYIILFIFHRVRPKIWWFSILDLFIIIPSVVYNLLMCLIKVKIFRQKAVHIARNKSVQKYTFWEVLKKCIPNIIFILILITIFLFLFYCIAPVKIEDKWFYFSWFKYIYISHRDYLIWPIFFTVYINCCIIICKFIQCLKFKPDEENTNYDSWFSQYANFKKL